MDKLICSGCGAALVPDTAQAYLTCAYCDTSIPNPCFVESHAQAAAQPKLAELCVQTLIEMGQNENLSEVDGSCFGNPVSGADAARAAMSIPDAEKIYLLYDRASLIGTLLGVLSEGFALTAGGLYYKTQSGSGSRSWEAFVTGSIALKDGTLSIGTSLDFTVSTDAEMRIARFLIDFHNRMYQQHTGQTAPASWTAEETVVQQKTSTGSIAGTLLTAAAGALLGRTSAQQRPAHRPVVRPQPTKVHPRREEHRPQPRAHQRPGMAGRPGGRPGMGGGRPGGHGGPGGRGRR